MKMNEPRRLHIEKFLTGVNFNLAKLTRTGQCVFEKIRVQIPDLVGAPPPPDIAFVLLNGWSNRTASSGNPVTLCTEFPAPTRFVPKGYRTCLQNGARLGFSCATASTVPMRPILVIPRFILTRCVAAAIGHWRFCVDNSSLETPELKLLEALYLLKCCGRIGGSLLKENFHQDTREQSKSWSLKFHSLIIDCNEISWKMTYLVREIAAVLLNLKGRSISDLSWCFTVIENLKLAISCIFTSTLFQSPNPGHFDCFDPNTQTHRYCQSILGQEYGVLRIRTDLYV
jgi:hypothetical protein